MSARVPTSPSRNSWRDPPVGDSTAANTTLVSRKTLRFFGVIFSPYLAQRGEHGIQRLPRSLPFLGKLVRNLIHARALGAHDDHAVSQIDQGKHVTFLDPVVLPQFLGKRDDPAPDYLHFEYVVHGVSNL